VLRYRVQDRAAVDERLRAEVAYVEWPPWGDRQYDKSYDIYSTRADVMRRAYRATHKLGVMVWDGRRWLRPVGGNGCGREGPAHMEDPREPPSSGARGDSVCNAHPN
jgi:hypothetical protein